MRGLRMRGLRIGGCWLPNCYGFRKPLPKAEIIENRESKIKTGAK
jgi:hypothetical protein